MSKKNSVKGRVKANETRAYREFVISELKRKGVHRADKVCHNGVFPKSLSSHDSKTLYLIYKEHFGTNHNDDFELPRRTPWSHIYEKKKEKDSTYVYVMANIEYSICKIGHSVDPTKRIKEVQTGCPYELKLIFMTKGSPALERKLHVKYDDLRLNGEWFSFTGELKESILNAGSNLIKTKT